MSNRQDVELDEEDRFVFVNKEITKAVDWVLSAGRKETIPTLLRQVLAQLPRDVLEEADLTHIELSLYDAIYGESEDKAFGEVVAKFAGSPPPDGRCFGDDEHVVFLDEGDMIAEQALESSVQLIPDRMKQDAVAVAIWKDQMAMRINDCFIPKSELDWLDDDEWVRRRPTELVLARDGHARRVPLGSWFEENLTERNRRKRDRKKRRKRGSRRPRR